MKIKVLTAYPNAIWGTHAAEWLSTAAALDVHGVHTLTEDPEAADAILFMEGHQGADMFMEEVLWHPLRRRYPDKTFIYHDWDYAFPLMQGIYPSIRAVHHKPGVSAGGVYLARIEENHPVSRARDLNLPQDLLYSFVGANNCEVRDRILKTNVPETYVADTTQRHAWLLSPEERATYEGEYASVCVRSRFMLSPRGIGPSTYRLFEAMEMGRCPVILSDDWVPPPFIPWEKFSLRVKESQVGDLPRILADAPHVALGRAAREAWEQHVDRPHAFHHLAETLRLILEQKVALQGTLRPYLDLLASDMRNLYLRARAKRVKRALKSLLASRPASAVPEAGGQGAKP